MSITDAYRPKTSIIAKLSKKGCIFIVVGGDGYPKLHENMIKRGVGPLQPKKHTFVKQLYQRYEKWSIDVEPPKPNSLKRQMGHN